MPEPVLHSCDVGFVFKRVGGGGRAQRVGCESLHAQADLRPVAHDVTIDAARGEGVVGVPVDVVPDWPEERGLLLVPVAGSI